MTDSRPAWKKSRPAKIYDYNYKVSEGYYQPQNKFIESRNLRREGETPPEHKTYAERYAEQPWYGEVRGLPYDESKSALSEPLYRLSDRKRGSSLVKEMREQEEDNIPLHIRASRRRKKFEEEERRKGVRPTVDSKDYFDHSSRLKDLKKEMYKINDDMIFNTRKSLPHDFGLPKSSFKYDVERYRDPVTGSNIHKTTHSEHKSSSSTYSSSNPISASRTSNEYSARAGLTDSVFKPWPTPRRNLSDDIPSVNYNRAEKFRETKRSQASKEVAESINQFADKIRISNLDPDIAYNFAHSVRSSSIEPISRRGSRKSRIVYGVAK